jgi:PAS domain S-box-containing protein
MTELLPYQSAFFSATMQSSFDAIIGANPSGVIPVWNATAAKPFGHSSDEITGKSIRLLVPRGRQAEETSILERVGKGETVPHFESVRLCKGGQPVEVAITASPIRDSSGQIIGASKTVRDITESKRHEERFRLVVEAAPNAIVVIDQEGRITLVNAQAEALFGYTRQELIGQRVETLIPERFRVGHDCLRRGFLKMPTARAVGVGRDLYAVRKDGREVPVEIGLSPVTIRDGALVLASILNITTRKRAEERVRLRSERLARSNRDLEQFAYLASHDLQETLRAVAGCVTLLQKRYQGQLDERADEFNMHAVDGCNRMQSLIDNLLAYSRIGRKEIERWTLECAAVLARAVRNLSASIEESDAQISCDSLPTVRAEPSQLGLLFQNLLANAIKFRKPGGIPRIRVSAERNGSGNVFSFADNGIGIAPEHFDRIFGVFRRRQTKREYPGTGIGLAVCKRIVEHYGGQIWAESRAGEGSTFRFTLPDASEAS